MPSRCRVHLVGVLILASYSCFAQREIQSLNGQWLFAPDSLRIGMREHWFSGGLPPTATSEVRVPHTWNTTPGLETYAGVGWYERTVQVPRSWSTSVTYIQFSGVYHDATVWVNGRSAGAHTGAGYTPFRLVVDSLLRYGDINTIRVAVDNSYSTRSIPYDRSFDWPNDGGIIRSVSLLAVPPLALDNLRISGRPWLSSGDSTGGTIDVSFDLRGSPGNPKKNLQYEIVVTDESTAKANVAFRQNYQLSSSTDQIRQRIDLQRVHPWNIDTPALYSLNVLLRDEGAVVDKIQSTFGFREIRSEGSRILLNGQPVRLMGVEWMPGSSLKGGMAESGEEMAKMLRLMRGVNAVFTRFHWEQDEAVFDWCDRHGILVQEEVPLWGGGTPLNDTLLPLARVHLDEMIRAHVNHPSIVMWGVGNELASRDPAIVEGVRELYRYAKSLDTTRLVTYVSNRLAFSRGHDASGVGDVLMFNEYQDTWYEGDPARIGSILDTIHLDYPDHPLVISEYGVCEPAFQGGDDRRAHDMIYHTAVYDSKPYVAGAIYFCLNDYRTHYGEAGEGVLRRRVHGVYDIDGHEKPSAQVLRRMSSPIRILNFPWNGTHQLELQLVGGGGLPSYPCRGYTLYWSKPGDDFRTRSRAVHLPDLSANQETRVSLDGFTGDSVVVTIVRPSGEVVDTREFSLGQTKNQ